MNASPKRQDRPTVVKKYANRRLYDTGRSSYVTLDDLCEMVKKGHDFVVYDAKSGEDLTRSVLTQIIVEQEGKGSNLLPTNFLRQLIGFYGDKFEGVVPNYLEQSLNAFTQNQEQFRDQIGKSMGDVTGIFPGLQAFEDLNKKNMAMFENAMRAMTPFPLRASSASDKPAPTKQERLRQIMQGISELQRELEKLQK
jgi:polyhydroxyalkanoate synthesis repressor PhaR